MIIGFSDNCAPENSILQTLNRTASFLKQAILGGVAMRKVIDLNCDMGEGFGHWSYGDAPDEDLMTLISSANIATGYHAGDPNSMNRMVSLAKAHGVALGAHPAYKDLQGFGRRKIDATNEELVNDILYQIGAMREFGRRHDMPLQHVKPHGALYMEAASNEDLSRHLVETLQATSPDLILYCMGPALTYDVAKRHSHPVVREFFADRDYGDDGMIIFTRKGAAADPKAIAQKCLRACQEGKVETESGKVMEVEFESICVHSDTPGSVEILTAIRKTLTDNGIRIASARDVLAENTSD